MPLTHFRRRTRPNGQPAWRQAGEHTANVTCFSFYANKTMTTGEGGMAVTDDQQLADRMRCMSLHGLSKDAWNRFRTGASWDYKIVAPGFKYNLTDIAAAIGIHQLERAEEMRERAGAIARFYIERMSHIEEIELPPDCRIACTPGICFRFGSAWIAWRSTATHSLRS